MHSPACSAKLARAAQLHGEDRSVQEGDKSRRCHRGNERPVRDGQGEKTSERRPVREMGRERCGTDAGRKASHAGARRGSDAQMEKGEKAGC